VAIGLEQLRIRSRSVVHDISAIGLTVYAGLCIVFGLMLWETPIFWRIDFGGLVINRLLLGYALPAVLALLLSFAARAAGFGGGNIHRPSAIVDGLDSRQPASN
jgi:hypothetical protein